ncbi:PAS domain-containing protein [Rhizobium leguminosarum]|uniref:PAS domain-containing protein n=1 Tax=Rhizobium leguminosarum TaxID=384 RepID=UPI001FEF6166|nr:PAS domain-containing protein [Rhizobium leguminosarum]
MSGETVYHEDFPLETTRHGQAETAYFTFCYSPIRDENGKVLGMIDTVMETTETVRARQRLVSESERYRQMFENAPGFMAVLSGPEDVFQYVNPAYSKLIGHREAVGRTVEEVLPEAVEQGFRAALNEIRQTGEPHSALGTLLTIKGPGGASFDRYVDFVYQPIKNASGEVTDIFVSGSDVTERMEADAALRRSEARLRFLDELNLETGRSRDADAILDITTRMVGAHLSISNCAYADMDEDGDGFTIRGDWAAEGSPSIVGHSLP